MSEIKRRINSVAAHMNKFRCPNSSSQFIGFYEMCSGQWHYELLSGMECGEVDAWLLVSGRSLSGRIHFAFGCRGMWVAFKSGYRS